MNDKTYRPMHPSVLKRNETVWTHVIDPEKKLKLDKASKSCKHCYGTGIVGTMVLLGSRLVCKCVVRQTSEDESVLAK